MEECCCSPLLLVGVEVGGGEAEEVVASVATASEVAAIFSDEVVITRGDE
jgi:hypothetical protein